MALTTNDIQKVDDFLAHHGVLGMKWGVRRYQNKDGSLTSAGLRRQEKQQATQIQAEAKYLKKGYSQKEASDAAEKYNKGRKIALGILAGAAAVGVGYLAYQAIGKRTTSILLKKGTELHYINALGDAIDFDRRLYTSFEAQDTKKYKGLLATALRKNAVNTTIYDTVLSATEDIKAPSQMEARKLFKEFSKTYDFKAANPFIMRNPTYTEVNVGMAGTIFGENKVSKDFMNFVKTKGYNAILDANDQFISGYGTKKPLILLNAASSTSKIGQSIVSKATSDKLNRIQMAKIYTKAFAPYIGLGMAIVGANKGKEKSNKYTTVNSYFEKNPQTKYSYGEVWNALEEEKGEFTVNQSLLKNGA